jgi:hypothetical protein
MAELEKHPTLMEQLKLLTEEVNSITDAVVFVPRSGELMKVIKILGEYPIRYGIHSDHDTQTKQYFACLLQSGLPLLGGVTNIW